MFLAGDAGGWRAQESLWGMTSQVLQVIDLTRRAVERAHRLMEKYSDVPMSLADATLVALAEDRDIRRVFTLDSDFAMYRFRGRRAFELLP